MTLQEIIDTAVEDGFLVHTQDNNYRCIVCDILCRAFGETLNHLMSEKHKKVMATANNQDVLINISPCIGPPTDEMAVKVVSSTKSPKSSLEEIKVKDPLQSAYVSLISKDPLTYFCNLCDLKLPYLDAITHVNGKGHRKKYINANKIRNAVQSKLLTLVSKDPPKYFCNKCSVKLGAFNDVVSHLDRNCLQKSKASGVRNASDNEMQIAMLLEAGDLALVSKKPLLYICNYCNTKLNSFQSVISHHYGINQGKNSGNDVMQVENALQSEHLLLLSACPFRYFCNICGISLDSFHNTLGHIKGNFHKASEKMNTTSNDMQIKNALESGYLAYVSHYPLTYFCNICSIELVSFHNIVGHLNGNFHTQSMKKHNSSNEVQKKQPLLKDAPVSNSNQHTNPLLTGLNSSIADLKQNSINNISTFHGSIDNKQPKNVVPSIKSSEITLQETKVENVMQSGDFALVSKAPHGCFCYKCNAEVDLYNFNSLHNENNCKNSKNACAKYLQIKNAALQSDFSFISKAFCRKFNENNVQVEITLDKEEEKVSKSSKRLLPNAEGDSNQITDIKPLIKGKNDPLLKKPIMSQFERSQLTSGMETSTLQIKDSNDCLCEVSEEENEKLNIENVVECGKGTEVIPKLVQKDLSLSNSDQPTNAFIKGVDSISSHSNHKGVENNCSYKTTPKSSELLKSTLGGEEIRNCSPLKSSKKKQSKSETLKKKEIYSQFCKYLMTELRNMEDEETIIAMKFISDVLFNVKVGKLKTTSRVVIINK